jgi:hypothetical protein
MPYAIASSAEEFAARMDQDKIALRRWFDVRLATAAQVITHSVSGSTFRAYRGTCRYTPSSLYRTWAQQAIVVPAIGASLEAIGTQDDFDRFHAGLAASLRVFWMENDETDLQWGRRCKLLDLLLKHLILWSELSETARTNLFRFAHVPLDKFTIKHISGICTDVRAKCCWTMGYVKTEDTYHRLQAAIRAAIGPSHPAILYDVLAWNSDHSDITSYFIRECTDNPGRYAEREFALVEKKNSKDAIWRGIELHRRGDQALAESAVANYTFGTADISHGNAI